jgi:hypothetical protein
VLVVWLGVSLAGVTGCTYGAESAPYRPTMSQLPPPTADQVRYKAETRTLTLSDPPQAGRWMVQRPDAPYPYPIGPRHTLPAGVDLDHTFVYYRQPGGRQSGALSLSQIQAAGKDHDSGI